MVELHGWLSIRETYEDEDSLPPKEIDEITRKVKDIISDSGIELRYANGEPYVNTLFCSNHRTSEVDEIIEAYKSVSKTATGSYGVIYLRDDDDAKHFNKFQIYVFKNGTCSQRSDEDFSPCIPTIESGIITE